MKNSERSVLIPEKVGGYFHDIPYSIRWRESDPLAI